MDGYITIGTKVDTKGAEEGLEELYNLIDNSDVAKGKKTTVIGDEVKKEAKEAKVAFEDLFEETEQMAEASGINLLNDQIALVTDKLEALKIEYADIKAEEPYAAQYKDLLDYAQKISATEKQLERLKQQADALNNTGFNALKKSVDDVSKGLTRTVKSVKRWVLGIFGVYSAYGAIRNAMNVISGQDEQLKADIDYMKNALAYTLEPVVRKIVELAKQLMTYIGYIIYQWTGYNIFENANKSLKKANGQAKALQKTMAGFDEMNVLNDSSGGGGGTPSFDLTSPENVDAPAWIKWIADNGEIVAGVITGITTALTLMKTLGLDPIMGLGIGAIVGGIVMLIKDIIDMIKDPSWENFAAILGDIAVIIGGIMLVTGNWWGLLVIILGLIVKYVAENWDKVKAILSVVGTWINEKIIKPVAGFFSGLWNGIKTGVSIAVNWIKEKFQPIKDFFSGLISKVVGAFNSGKTKVTDGLNGVKSTFINIINKIIDGLNKFIRGLNKIHFSIPDWLGGGSFGINIKEIPRLARGGIVNNPGRGVIMGNYVAGENGAEAVLPLTDDTLQRLANMIPITVNLTNTMNGRVISRELKKVQNENDFAFNR